MLETAPCWSSLMGDASHPIAPLSGVPGEPTFHSGHPVFRRGMRTYHGGRAQACVCLCWALSSLEDPAFPLMECPRMLGKTAWLRAVLVFPCCCSPWRRWGGGGCCFPRSLSGQSPVALVEDFSLRLPFHTSDGSPIGSTVLDSLQT